MPKKTECEYCHKKFGCRIIYDHYGDCLKTIYKDKSGILFRFFSHGITGEVYFIYAIIGKKCTFTNIDNFLKEIWCECCGHLSEFREFHDAPAKKIGKSTKITNYEVGDRFMYEYDFGTTTTIFGEILEILDGEENNKKIELVKQNDQPQFSCVVCKKDAEYFYNGSCPFLCEECKNKFKKLMKKTDDVESNDEDFTNITELSNSPRVGLCGYV
jgi:hypothetical protein